MLVNRLNLIHDACLRSWHAPISDNDLVQVGQVFEFGNAHAFNGWHVGVTHRDSCARPRSTRVSALEAIGRGSLCEDDVEALRDVDDSCDEAKLVSCECRMSRVVGIEGGVDQALESPRYACEILLLLPFRLPSRAELAELLASLF